MSDGVDLHGARPGINSVEDAVGPSADRVQTFVGFPEWLADPVGIVSHRSSDQFVRGRGDVLWEVFGQRPACRGLIPDGPTIAHALPCPLNRSRMIRAISSSEV